jgi:hypothetical protein
VSSSCSVSNFNLKPQNQKPRGATLRGFFVELFGILY